jgi:MATE family multidrug resistance protein
MNHTDKQILQIALPSIVSNITVPLLGMIDVAIVGHIGDAAYIGAVAVGSMIFNLIYWIFAFLRMGTSGLTSQALGRRDVAGVSSLLVRSLAVALLVSVLIIVLQEPLQWLMFRLVGPTPDVLPLAARYFSIVVWGAPAVLGLYGLSGWYIGMQNTRIPMAISIMQNVANILASLLFVFGMGMKIEGVAIGTVLAQYAGFVVALVMLAPLPVDLRGRRAWRRIVRSARSLSWTSGWNGMFKVNRDIFLRTLFLVAVSLYFTSVSAKQGAVVLAVNTVLMQLYLLFSYVMDGFAYAGEALCGLFHGARNGKAFRSVVRRLFGWGAAVVAVFTACYVFAGHWFVHLLTTDVQVLTVMDDYLWWSWFIPVAGVAAFIWDGVFIGITATRAMLLSAVVSASVFFLTCLLLLPLMGNHGLWLAMLLFLAMRGVMQTAIYRYRLSLFA